MPKHINIYQTNERCDMAVGPCSCGAWHLLKDWKNTKSLEGTDQQNEFLFGKQMAEVDKIIEFIEHMSKNGC